MSIESIVTKHHFAMRRVPDRHADVAVTDRFASVSSALTIGRSWNRRRSSRRSVESSANVSEHDIKSRATRPVQR